MKVILILVDGMRPDALEHCETAQKMIKKSSYTMNGTCVKPSGTLACHMSLFHSTDPKRHGITDNFYIPPTEPIEGLCEVLHKHGKTCGFFYNYEELRDLSRPGSLDVSFYFRGTVVNGEEANERVTQEAIRYVREGVLDFIFLYLGFTDEVGHSYGWMSPPYLDAVRSSWDNIHSVLEQLDEEYRVIISADHGGHDKIHHICLPEDMTIPMIFYGKEFTPGKELTNINIMDIAPTITKLMQIAQPVTWVGKAVYD